jgi:hypothetical protein
MVEVHEQHVVGTHARDLLRHDPTVDTVARDERQA